METRRTLYGGILLYLAAENGHEVVVKLPLGVKKVKADVKDSFGRIPISMRLKMVIVSSNVHSFQQRH